MLDANINTLKEELFPELDYSASRTFGSELPELLTDTPLTGGLVCLIKRR